jgi:hypothetical protein
MVSGGAVQRADVQWVVESIDQGDMRRRAGDGDRYLAAMTVNLLQYTAGDVLVERSPSRKHASKGKQGTHGSRGRKTYTVKAGDHSLRRSPLAQTSTATRAVEEDRARQRHP